MPVIGSSARALRRLYDWMGTLVHHPYGIYLLALCFFIEAIVIIPAGPLLVLFCSERPERSFIFGLVATIASVLGGVVAYYIGLGIWDLAGHRLVECITTPEKFDYLCQQYQTHEASAILIAGCTPIPYQIITLTAGFCRVSFAPFLACVSLVRAARLFLISTVMFIWGPSIKLHIDRSFNALVLLFIVILVLVLFAIT